MIRERAVRRIGKVETARVIEESTTRGEGLHREGEHLKIRKTE